MTEENPYLALLNEEEENPYLSLLSAKKPLGEIPAPKADRTWSEVPTDGALSLRTGTRSATSGVLGTPVGVLNMALEPWYASKINELIGQPSSVQVIRALFDESNKAGILETLRGKASPEAYGSRGIGQPDLVRGMQDSIDANNTQDVQERGSAELKTGLAEMGQTHGAWDATKLLVKRPSLLGYMGAQQIPNLVINRVPGSTLGTTAAMGVNAGAQAESEVFTELQKQVAAGTMTEAQATQIASDAGQRSTALNMVLPYAFGPGARVTERVLAGRPLANAAEQSVLGSVVRGTAFEGLEEGVTESSEQISKNYATGSPLLEGAGAAGVFGAAMGAPIGGTMGGIETITAKANNRAQVTPPNQTTETTETTPVTAPVAEPVAQGNRASVVPPNAPTVDPAGLDAAITGAPVAPVASPLGTSPPVMDATAGISQPQATAPAQVEPNLDNLRAMFDNPDMMAKLGITPPTPTLGDTNDTGRYESNQGAYAGNPEAANPETVERFSTNPAPNTNAAADRGPSVANQGQTANAVNRLAELETKSDVQALAPDESMEYVRLLKADRTAGKVGGRVMPGVKNSTAYTQAKDAGQLKPVQAFLDADNFKRINDELNHDAGDDAISQIGQALFDELGEGNVFHRSGDEFIVQGDDPAAIDAAMARARDRLSKAKLQVTLPDGTVIERTGIGFSYGSGKDITEAENAQRTDKQNRAAAGLRTERRADSGRVDSGADQTPATGRPQKSQSVGNAPANGRRKWVQKLIKGKPVTRPGKNGKPVPVKVPTIDYKNDTLLHWLGAAGGINFDSVNKQLGIDKALFKDKLNRPFGRTHSVLRRNDGMTLDEIYEKMKEDGWLLPDSETGQARDDAGAMEDMLMDALAGRPVYHPYEGRAGRDSETRDARQAEPGNFSTADEVAQEEGFENANEREAFELYVANELEKEQIDDGIEFDEMLEAAYKEGDYGPDAREKSDSEANSGRVEEDSPGLFTQATSKETVEAERRKRDSDRDGRTGSGRTDMLSGDGELFAGNAPEQGSFASKVESTNDMFVKTRGNAQNENANSKTQSTEGLDAESVQPRVDASPSLIRRGKYEIESLVRRFGGSVLIDTIARDFKETETSLLIGKKVKNAEDLAALASVYRNPLFETLRYIFINTATGEVLGETAVSSRMPTASAILPSGIEINHLGNWIDEQAKRFGANGFWMVHNHPSGNPKPSKADVQMTAQVKRKVRGAWPMGHVVLNHKTYGHIGPSGNYIGIKEISGVTGQDPLRQEDEITVDLKIGSSDTAAAVAKGLYDRTDANSAAVMTIDANSTVVSAMTFPRKMLSTLKFAALMSIMTKRSGSAMNVITLPEAVYAMHKAALNKMARNGIFLDIITVAPDGNVTSLLKTRKIFGKTSPTLLERNGKGDRAVLVREDGKEPNQIKSATGNSGAFDAGNPSIVRSDIAPYKATGPMLPVGATTASIVNDGLIVNLVNSAEAAGADLTQLKEAYASRNPQDLLKAIDALLTKIQTNSVRVTGTKNAVVDAEREAAGREPIERTGPRSNEETLAMAKAELAENPIRGKELVEQLKTDSVQNISSVDEAVLMVEKTDLMNRRDAMARKASDTSASEESRTAAKRQWQALESQINDIDQATYNAGSEWGRFGQFHQRTMREDFTLAALERKERVRLGRGLEPSESNRLKVMAAKIAELTENLEVTRKKLEDAEARANVQVTYESLIKDMGLAIGKQAPRNVINLESFKARADKARAALAALDDVGNSKKKGQAGAVINPVAFVYLAEIGAYHVAKGANELAKFIVAMKESLGDKFDQYKDAIKDVFTASKIQAQALGNKRAKTPDPIDPDNLTHKDVYDLARVKVQEGLRGEDAVMKAVHADLVKIFPDLSERDVRRLFSEYGKAKFPSKDADKKELREIRALVQMQESIDRLEAGLDALKSGVQRDKDTQLIREKRRELNDLLKRQIKKTIASPEKLASYQEARANNLKHQIEDLEKQIRTGEKPERAPAPVPNAEVVRLVAQRDALRKQFDAVWGPAKKTPDERYQQSRATSLARQLKLLQERIAANDYARNVKPLPRELNAANEKAAYDLQKAKEVFLRHQLEEELKARNAFEKIFDFVGQSANLSRAIMTSFDLSAVGRQGGILSAAHPVLAAQAASDMMGALVSDVKAQAINDQIAKRANARLYKEAGLELTDFGAPDAKKLEENFAARWIELLEKNPSDAQAMALAKKFRNLATSPVRASGRAYIAYLNKMRADVFDLLIEDLKTGAKPTLKEAQHIAQYVNITTGRGNIGKTKDFGAVANLLLFAPRLLVSRFQYLTVMPTLMGGTNRTKMLIVKEYARTMRGSLVVMGLGLMAYMMAGDDDEEEKPPFMVFDPRSTDFLKMRFGETRVDPLYGLLQATVFLSRVVSGETMSNDGVITPIREQYRISDLYTDPQDRVVPELVDKKGDGVIWNFMRQKAAPIPGAIVNFTSGTDMNGADATPGSIAVGLVTPMSLGNVADLMKAHGVPAGAALFGANVLGMGVSHHGKTDEQRAAAMFSDVDKARADMKQRLSEVPTSQWQAELEAIKKKNPALDDVELDVYKDSTQNRNLGRAGEPKMTEEGLPKFEYNRLAKPAKYNANYRAKLEAQGLSDAQIAEAEKKNQVHHLISDNIVRHHPLMAASRKAGYDLDNQNNLIGMAGKKSESEDLGHRTEHPEYDKLVVIELNRAHDDLIDAYGEIDKVPEKKLIDAVKKVEDTMRAKILKRDVPIKDNRLAGIFEGAENAV